MTNLPLIQRVFGIAVVTFVVAGEPVFAQSSPYGLLSDMWSMPTYRGYSGWQPYARMDCCGLPSVASQCGTNCDVRPWQSDFGNKPDSILFPERDDVGAGGPTLPPGHNKCSPCRTCAPAGASPQSQVSPPATRANPVGHSSRRTAVATKPNLAPLQIVQRRQSRPLSVSQSSAGRFPENDGWIPVVETKTASR